MSIPSNGVYANATGDDWLIQGVDYNGKVVLVCFVLLRIITVFTQEAGVDLNYLTFPQRIDFRGRHFAGPYTKPLDVVIGSDKPAELLGKA